MNFSFEAPFSWLLIGSSGSGKTQLLKQVLKRDLLDQTFLFDNIVIMCPTLEFSGDFKEYEYDEDGRPNKKIFTEFSTDVINDLIDEMKFLIKKYGKERTPQVLLILDDCLENMTYHSIINTLFIKGRHLNISTIVLCQQLKRIGRTMRINAKYLTCFRCGNSGEFDDVMDEYVGKREREDIRKETTDYLNQNLWSFLHCNLKTQDFTKRYALGKNGELEKYV